LAYHKYNFCVTWTRVGTLQLQSWVLALHPPQEGIVVLAHEGLLVVAGNVVPLDAILVQVVEDSHAGLGGPVDVELGVVGLRASSVSLVAPWLVAPAWRGGVGGRHLGVGVGPEPPEDIDGLEVSTFLAGGEVTEAAGGPDVAEVTLGDEVEDHVVLGDGLDTDGVHAPLTALVTGLEPVYLPSLEVHMVLVPREEVPVVAELPLLGP